MTLPINHTSERLEIALTDVETELRMRGFRVRRYTKAELERGRITIALRSGLDEQQDHGR